MRGPNTDDDWHVWRLVLDGVATLHEIETHWSITDVLDANEALDVQADVSEWRKRTDRANAEVDRDRAAAIRALTGGR